jgi:thymidine kinase
MSSSSTYVFNVSRCFKPADITQKVSNAGAAFVNGKPSVCGGTTTYDDILAKCYTNDFKSDGDGQL